MSILDGFIADVVEDVLEATATKATLRRTPVATYNPLTDVSTPGTSVDYTVYATPPGQVDLNLVGTEGVPNILRGHRKFFINAKSLAIVPTVGTDVLIFGGSTFEIVHVAKVYGGEEVAGYILVCKG